MIRFAPKICPLCHQEVPPLTMRTCPAPKIRGKAGETCDLPFHPKRPNQVYCSATCQSRANTRASRTDTETPHMRIKRERRELHG